MAKCFQKILVACFMIITSLVPGIVFSDASDDNTEPMPGERHSQEIESQKVETEDKPQEMPVQAPEKPFDSFTGKLSKNKVRLRLQPNIEAPILKELSQGDLLIVVGESDDYYAVQAPEGIKGYVFRTYILDNVVEANKVNVRMEPNLDSPVIAQLSTGDKVDGTISTVNNKWLEITPPSTARFYVAKDFVENIGNPSTMAAIMKKRNDVNQLLNATYLASETEMQKEFPEIRLEGVYANLNKVMNQYPEFTEQVNRAKELTKVLQEGYLQKKLVYLENREKMNQSDLALKTSEMSEKVKAQQEKLSNLEQQLNKERNAKRGPGTANNAKIAPNSASANTGVNVKMAAWAPVEEALYKTWAQQNEQKSIDVFYQEQGAQAVALHGIVEPYTRVIKNKPGDYVLVNQTSHLPIAYLYSTLVNLQDVVGQELTVYGAPRPNNNFAFPSYFVLTTE